MPKTLTLEIESPHARHTVHVPRDRREQKLVDLLRQLDLPLNTRCGQRGVCDGCTVELVAGTLIHSDTGQLFTPDAEPLAVRGCQCRLGGSETVKVRIPPRSLLAYQPQIVTEFRINVPRAHDPLYQTVAVDPREFPAELSLEQALCAAVARICDLPVPLRLDPTAVPDPALRAAPALYATVERREDHWLISAIAEQPEESPVGAAIDIGTTTVAALLVDLSDGAILAQSAAFNEQMRLGDDVVTRITLCCNDPANLDKLQRAVGERTIAPLLQQALRQAGISPRRLACVTLAGNTTMLHLAAGISPASMGVAPFTPEFLDHRVLTAAQVLRGACVNAAREQAAVHLLPSPAAYVGADLSAGVIASGLLYDDGPSLLVDVGTNGEIILKHGGKFYGCATAAGPAFEGAGLSCGIRAGDGAVSHVRMSASPFSIDVDWIGIERNSEPTGLCGSAYIDFLAEGRRVGLLGPAGRFDLDAVPDAAAKIVPWNGGDLALRLARGQGGRDVVISQLDISRLLQAKAAIAAGLLTLLHRIGLTPGQIKTVYLAGGFGTHMDRAAAIRCGLLPGFTAEQIQAVGNTSLAGAYLALLDSSVLGEISRIGQQLEVIELNLDPQFEERFIDCLALPD